MRKMRLLTVLAVMLLSCGIANAQTVRGDVNLDQKVDGEDILRDYVAPVRIVKNVKALIAA